MQQVSRVGDVVAGAEFDGLVGEAGSGPTCGQEHVFHHARHVRFGDAGRARFGLDAIEVAAVALLTTPFLPAGLPVLLALTGLALTFAGEKTNR